MLLEEEARDSHQIQVSLLFSFLLLLSMIHFSLRLMLSFLSFFLPFLFLISASISDSKYFSSFLLPPSFLTVIDFEMLCTPKESSSLPSDIFRKNSTFYTTTGRKSRRIRETEIPKDLLVVKNSLFVWLLSPDSFSLQIFLWKDCLLSLIPFTFSHMNVSICLTFLPSCLVSGPGNCSLFFIQSVFMSCSFLLFLEILQTTLLLVFVILLCSSLDSWLKSLWPQFRAHHSPLPISCLFKLLPILILSSSHFVLLRNYCSLSILTGFSH